MKFPLFIDLCGKKALVVGSGRIGGRRAEILKRFGAEVYIVDPKSTFENAEKRAFQDSDTDGKDLVLACTDDRGTNRHIGKVCKQKNILVSVADSAEESTFFFPALCENGELCIGIVSDGSDHTLVKETAKKIRDIL